MGISQDKLTELQEDTVVTNKVHHSVFPMLLRTALEAKCRNQRKNVLFEIGNEKLNKYDDKVLAYGFYRFISFRNEFETMILRFRLGT